MGRYLSKNNKIKKNEKKLKKSVDKAKSMWYNSQAVRKGRQTVIEN